MSAFEGAEYGVGDFVLLESINIDDFMKNLQLRYSFILNDLPNHRIHLENIFFKDLIKIKFIHILVK